MKKALIMHGTAAGSRDNWFIWLKNELENRNWEVWLPELPDARTPNVSKYNAFLFSNKDFIFDEETVLIGHSSGAVAILGLLQHLPVGTKVGECFLVGAFRNDLGWQSLKELFLEKFNFDLIKSKAKRIVFIHSDNDPYCPLEQAKYLCEQVGGELIMIPGQGHFNTEADPKYRQFGELLEMIIGEKK